MENILNVNKHILIVEDDAPCRLLVKTILEDAGCSFDVATNGLEAVEKVKQEHFDAVLMDVRMPVLNGFEASNQIRQIEKNLPIIALTAWVFPWSKDKCLESGMNDYLTKPFEKKQLLEKLLKWTGISSSRAGLYS